MLGLSPLIRRAARTQRKSLLAEPAARLSVPPDCVCPERAAQRFPLGVTERAEQGGSWAGGAQAGTGGTEGHSASQSVKTAGLSANGRCKATPQGSQQKKLAHKESRQQGLFLVKLKRKGRNAAVWLCVKIRCQRAQSTAWLSRL